MAVGGSPLRAFTWPNIETGRRQRQEDRFLPTLPMSAGLCFFFLLISYSDLRGSGAVEMTDAAREYRQHTRKLRMVRASQSRCHQSMCFHRGNSSWSESTFGLQTYTTISWHAFFCTMQLQGIGPLRLVMGPPSASPRLELDVALSPDSLQERA